MRVSRFSGVALIALIAGLLSPVSAALADPPAPPSAAITSPADASDQKGVVTVTANGTADYLNGDTPISIELQVDSLAAPGVPDVPCPAVADGTCPATFTWDATGLPDGPYVLTAVMTTAITGVVTSLPVAVNVTSPRPHVTLTAPTGSTVTGLTTVTAIGTIDPSQTDTGASMAFTYNGVAIGNGPCPTPLSRSCTVSIDWDTTRLNATHQLKVTFTTSNGLTDTDAKSVTESNLPPTAVVQSPDGLSGLKGPITVAATGTTRPTQTDTPISMQLLVDDHATGSPVACPTGGADPNSCPLTFAFDATGLTGPHDFSVSLHTHHAPDVVSPAVTDNFVSPAPTVAITAPVQGATVFGIVPITVTGTVDPSQTDTGHTLQLLVNNAVLDTVDCPAARACTLTYQWDASGIVGARTLKATFTTNGGRSATPDTTDVNVVSAPPAAVVLSPVNGSTVSGPITIVTQGSVSPTQNDHPALMQLLIDGTATAAAAPCTETAALPHGCSLSYGWDTTGLTGTHTLQAKFGTSKGVTALSAVTTITVVSPLPTVAITSPTTSSTVHRTATITVSGAVDATQTDSPSSIRLTLDGAALGGVIPCAPAVATPRSCLASYTWNTVGLTGRHTLLATVVSAKGLVGTSSATTVFVYGGTKTVIAPAKATPAGRSVTYTGRVTTLINKLGVPGVKVKVVIVPATGKAKTLIVLTNVHGFFKVAFKPAVNTTVTATLVSLPYYGTSHTFTKLHVVPLFKCSVGGSVARNRLDQGACRIANLPRTTKVTLQYEFAGHWYTLGSGKAKSTLLPFSFRFAKRGTYYVRVVLSATSVFAGATGPSLKVAVT